MATSNEIARLIAAIGIMRPDWNLESLRTIIQRRHATRPIRDLTIALAWIATDPDSLHPGRLDQHGPWWTATNTTATIGPPRYNPATDAVTATGRPIPPEARELIHNHRPIQTAHTPQPVDMRTPPGAEK